MMALLVILGVSFLEAPMEVVPMEVAPMEVALMEVAPMEVAPMVVAPMVVTHMVVALMNPLHRNQALVSQLACVEDCSLTDSRNVVKVSLYL